MQESELRQEAFDQYFDQINNEIVKIKQQLKGTLTDMAESSCAMESRYDSFREDAEYMHVGHQKRLQALEELMKVLTGIKQICIRVRNKIESGALVTLEQEDGGVSKYFLIPGGSGRDITVKGETYKAISHDSPLGKALLGKEVGDEVSFVAGKIRGQMEVVEIL